MASGQQEDLKAKWMGRRNTPVSPATMVVAGIVTAGAVGYFFYANKKRQTNDGNRRAVDNGYIVVTARSKKKGDVVKKVWLVCDRGGEHKAVATRRRSGSKKIGCPFKLVGVYNEKRLVWQLEVRNDEHNHEAAQHLEGHPFVRRLSQDEQKMVAQLTEQHMDPRNILSTIKKQNPDNVSRRSCNECRRGSVLLSSKVVHILASIPSCADDWRAFPEGSTAFGRCAKFRTMRIGRQKAIDWDVLTEIGERERAEHWIGEETPWRRLFELAFQPSYREVVVEFLSTFTFRPGGVPEVVFSMLRQRHEMSLAEFAVITGLYWEPETVTPLYTAGITEIDDATLRAWWPHIADDPFRGTKARVSRIRDL
ncbi:hypothetical protein E3N88_33545 [Mikania micrantha]|uniref:FAR1 domain-containing protein n=1 Tax=Mikania micrantha TaxID=192012 RepID=A0A5N6MBR3_9ASTR|nr:hypothetical protein E3N88_33545 [Mikania micrantha]